MRELRVLGHYVSFPLIMLSVVDLLAMGLLLHLFLMDVDHGALPVLAAVGAITALLANAAVGLYQIQLRAGLPGILTRAVVAFLLGVPVLGIGALLLSLGWRETVFVCAVSAMAYGILGFLHATFFGLADAGILRRRVLVLGEEEASGLGRLRRRCDRRGFQVVGYLAMTERGAAGVRERLWEYAQRRGADEIVVAIKDRRGTMPAAELMECRLNGMPVISLGRFLERETGKVRVDLLHPSDFAFEANSVGRLQETIKRTVDIIGALLLLALSVPVTLGTMLAIKREEGWNAPVFYRQARVGKDGVPFELIKFRSMRLDAEADGTPRWATPDDGRVTRVGRIIRKLRIDELPQLLNVLRGQMSLVGPRPERPSFVAQLEQRIPYYAVRHRVKPGVTGWAQLLYPYGASVADAAEKLQFDLYYIKNRSVVLDSVILLETVEVVLFGKGAR